MFEYKVCVRCAKSLPIDMFRLTLGKYRRSECRECDKSARRAVRHIRSFIQEFPGDDYICPICKRNGEEIKLKGGRKSGTWCCDHDHKTLKFRGWLCHSCNRGLGVMNDSVDQLEAAIDYLKMSRTSNENMSSNLQSFFEEPSIQLDSVEKKQQS